MIDKLAMILSYFLIPIILIVFKNIEAIYMSTAQTSKAEYQILMFWGILFIIVVISTIRFCITFKKDGIEETRMDKKKIKIKDSKYNLHIFEYWFLIISPCMIFSGTNEVSIVAILFTFLVIAILLFRQNIFSYNLILIIIGYNFYLVDYKNNEYIICSKKSYSELKTSLKNDTKIIRITSSNYLYLP